MMKPMMKSIFVLVIMLTGLTNLQAGNDKEKEKFKVDGVCGMCEDRIENAAEAVDGVHKANWDQITKMIVVKYDPAKVELMDIHKAIAKVGHDTEKVTADDETYNNLHSCCKYRESDEGCSGEHEGHNH